VFGQIGRLARCNGGADLCVCRWMPSRSDESTSARFASGPRRSIFVAVVILAMLLGASLVAVGIQGRSSRSAFQAPTPSTKTSPRAPLDKRSFPPEAVYPGFQPSGVAFWNDRHGLIVGGLPAGVPYGDCFSCRGLIAVSHDGGRYWRVIKSLGHPWPTSVVTGPPGYAWVTLANGQYGNSVALLRTTDGGSHWSLLRVGMSSLSFPTASDGWGIDGGQDPYLGAAQIARTTDGGRTWTTVRLPCPDRLGGPAAVSFATPTTGWAVCVGQPGAGSQEKAIIQTQDGGASWRVDADASISGMRHGETAGLSGGGYPTGLYFASNTAGWLVGDRMSAYATTDGASHWSPIRLGSPGDGTGPSAIDFVSPETGFALVRSGTATDSLALRLLASTDGGRRWRVIHSWRLLA
jgi:photosystem II stability/assembly factor-like uncharacterized protein